MSALLPSFVIAFYDNQVVAQFDPAELPAGTSVSVSVVDASGTPLAVQPQVTNPGPGILLIHVTPTPNSVIRARLETAQGQKTAIQEVTIHTLGPVQSLQFGALAGTVTARWTAPTRAQGVTVDPGSYRFRLVDENRKPYANQPQVTFGASGTDLTFAVGSLDYGKTYIAQINAALENSIGADTYSPKLVLGSTQLQDLRQRLQAALDPQNTLRLTAAVVQIAEITDLFVPLFTAHDGSLPVSQASITPEAHGLVVNGSLAAANPPGSTAITFTAQPSGVPAMSFDVQIGSRTVAQLRQGGFLSSTATPPAWEAAAPTIPNITLAFNSATSVQALGQATAAPWPLGTGIPGVTFGVAQATFAVARGATGTLTTSGSLTTTLVPPQASQDLDLPIPATVAIPNPDGPWMVDAQVSARSLDAIGFLSGNAVFDLPPALVSPAIHCNVHFEIPQTASGTMTIRAEIPLGALWQPFPSPVDIQIQAPVLGIDSATGSGPNAAVNFVSSAITGTLIASGNGAHLSAGIAMVPAGTAGSYSLHSTGRLAGTGVPAIGALLGDDFALATAIAGRLGPVGALALTPIRFGIEFRADTAAGEITLVHATFTPVHWAPDGPDWLSFTSPVFLLQAANPFGPAASRSATGKVDALLHLPRNHPAVSVPVQMDFTHPAWTLAMVSGIGHAHFPLTLTDIEGLFPSGTIAGLAAQLNPGTSVLTNLRAVFSPSTGAHPPAELSVSITAQSLSLSLGRVVLGPTHLTFSSARVPPVVTLHIAGGVESTPEGDVQYSATCHLPQPLVLEGTFPPPSLDMAALLTTEGFAYSGNAGLPTTLPCSNALKKVWPAAGRYTITGSSSAQWAFSFGLSPLTVDFQIDNLGAEFDSDFTNTSAEITGTLVYGPAAAPTFSGPAVAALASTGPISEVTATLAAGSPQLAQLVDGLGGTGTYTGSSTTVFAKPRTIDNAQIRVNLALNTFLVYGSYPAGTSGFGQTALLLKQKGSSGFGFLLATGLATTGTNGFSDISSALAGLPAFGVARNRCAIVLTNLGTSSAPEPIAASDLASIPTLPPTATVQAGLNVLASFELSTSVTLQNNLSAIATVGTSPLTTGAGTLVLFGNISSETAPITLTAQLPDLTLFNTFAFQSVTLNYNASAPSGTPAKRSVTLSVNGSLTVVIDGITLPQFTGQMVVTEDTARFSVVTTNSIDNPLGIPGISLQGLGVQFDIKYTASAITQQVGLVGSVVFSSAVSLTAQVIWLPGTGRTSFTPQAVVLQVQRSGATWSTSDGTLINITVANSIAAVHLSVNHGLTSPPDPSVQVSGSANPSLNGIMDVTVDPTAPTSFTFQTAAPNGVYHEAALGVQVQPPDLKLSDLLSKVIGLSWPADAFDIDLGNGHLAWVPGMAAVDIQEGDDTLTFQPGFSGQATATILSESIDLDVVLHTTGATGSGTRGVEASGQFANEIDFGFLQFTSGAGDQKGPRLSIDTRPAPRKFEIVAGLTMFSLDLGQIDITVTSQGFEASLTLPSGAGPFAGKVLSFEVKKDPVTHKRVFKVDSFPVPDLHMPNLSLPNFSKRSGDCPNINIADDIPLTGNWNVDISFEIQPDPIAMVITATPTYTVTLNRSSNNLGSFSVPAFTFNIPLPTGPFTWSNFGETLIENCAQAVFTAAADNPQGLADMVAIQGLKTGLNALSNYLACKLQQAVTDAIEDAARALIADVASDVALWGGVTILVGGLIDQSHVSGSPGDPPPAKPVTPALSFSNGLLVDWTGSDNSQVITYVVTVTSPNTPAVVRKVVGGTFSVSIPASSLAMGAVCQVTVQGFRGTVAGAVGTPASFHLPPGAPTLAYQNEALVVSWTDVQWGASTPPSYTLALTNSQNQPIAIPQVVQSKTGTAWQASIPLWTFPGGNPLNVRASVTAAIPGVTVTGPAAQIALPLSLAAPSSFSVQQAGTQIQAAWHAVPNATGYEIRLTNAQGVPQPVTAVATTTATVDASALLGQNIVVSVRATSATALGTQSSASLQVSLPAPAMLMAFLDANSGSLNIAWQPPAGGLSYSYQVHVDGTAPPLDATVNTTSTAFPHVTTTALTVTVKAMINNVQGPPATIQVSVPSLPSGTPSLSFDGDKFRVDWAGAPATLQYRAKVFHAQPLPASDFVEADQTSAGLPVSLSGSFSGGEYYARVSVVGSTGRSLEVSSNHVLVPGAPGNLQLTPASAVTGVTVSWQPGTLPNASQAAPPASVSYLVTLTDAGNRFPAAASGPITVTATSVDFALAAGAGASSANFSVSVREIAQGVRSQAATLGMTLTVFAAPQFDLTHTVFTRPNTLSVQFNAVAGATRYRLVAYILDTLQIIVPASIIPAPPGAGPVTATFQASIPAGMTQLTLVVVGLAADSIGLVGMTAIDIHA